MGAVYESFERELAAWDRRYSDSPREEMIALCLLALEREPDVRALVAALTPAMAAAAG